MPIVEVEDGARIHYTLHGEGPPVLLLQGVGVPWQGWNPQIEGLRGRYRLIAVDNRGIGKSTLGSGELSIERMAADALAVLDHADVPRAHVAAHSMGGQIALELALCHRDRVASLALMCTFADGRPVAAPRWFSIWFGLRTIIGTRRMRRRAWARMLTPVSSHDGADFDALADELSAAIGRDLADAPAIRMKQVGALGRYDATPRLAELAGLPVLVLSAEEDRIARPALGRALADGIDGAQYHELKASGHVVTLQRATEVNEIFATHLEAAAE